MIRRRAGGLKAAGLALALAFPAAWPALAQQAAPPPPPLQISADHMSGSHGPEGDEVTLRGNVRIVRGRTVLTAETGRYLRALGRLHLQGSVKMVDSTTTVTCDEATYSEIEDVLQLHGDVQVEDGTAILRAPAATYDRGVGLVELYGGVEGTDRDQLIAADRVFYDRDLRVLQARGNVHGMDEKNKFEVNARSVDYDRDSREALATGSPSLRQYDERNRPTIIRADTLRFNTETRVAEAIDSVLVERDTLRARADYGLFDDEAQRGWLLGNPRAWDNETTVRGDTLEMWTNERRLERVVVRGGAIVEYHGTLTASAGESSRLVGDRVDVFFTDEAMDSLIAIGKARNEYRSPPASGMTAEENLTVGDTITVYFRGGGIDRAVIQGGARGEYRVPASAADTAAANKEIIRYDAKQIAYDVGRNQILLEGAAHMVYRDLELTARRVEYDVNKQTLVANGNPELLDRGGKMSGQVMTYDLESRVGNVYQAETGFEKGLYHGSRIRKATDNELDVLDGSYSTCSLDEPHYHFQAHWMKVYLRDKVVAKPVVFYVGKVPLFALPFWIFPIKPGRHSGFLLPQIELGFTNTAGQFIRNAGYYWATNDYMDFTLTGDYYQFEPSWVLRLESVYKKLYLLDGYAKASYARNDNPNARSVNWDLNAYHTHELLPTTRLTARAAFVSSRDYNSSNLYGRSFAQRYNRFLTSDLALSHSADWGSLNLALERREDLDANAELEDPDGEAGPDQGAPPGTRSALTSLRESMPTVSLAFPTRSLGSLGFIRGTKYEKPLSTLYFDLETRYNYLRERTGIVSGYRYFVRDGELDSTTVVEEQVAVRSGLGATTSLADARRLFGWLNVRPSLTGNVAIFDHDELGNKNVPTGTWSTAMTTSTTFYGTFRPTLGPLTGLRHVLFPTLSLAYAPEFPHLIYTDENGVKRSRFQSFGIIGISGFEQFRANFGLEQRLQVKLKRKDQVQRIDNLVSWNLGGSYNFLYKEQGFEHPLSVIGSNVFIQPPGVFSGSLSWATNVYSPRPVQSLGYNLGLRLARGQRRTSGSPELPIYAGGAESSAQASGDWNVDLAYSYTGGYETPNQWSSKTTTNVVLRWQFSPAWGFDYSTSYDVTNREVGLQHFSLSRSLHCWEGIFTRTFAPNGEAEYYFRIGVKDQREIYVDRGTRGSSIGGID